MSKRIAADIEYLFEEVFNALVRTTEDTPAYVQGTASERRRIARGLNKTNRLYRERLLSLLAASHPQLAPPVRDEKENDHAE